MPRPPAHTFVLNPLTKSIAYLHEYRFDEAIVSLRQVGKGIRMMNIPMARFQHVQAPEIGTRARPIGTNTEHTIIDYDIANNTVTLTNGVKVDMPSFIENWEYQTPIGTQTQNWTTQL